MADEGAVPAMHLSAEDLEELERLLYLDTTDPEFTVEYRHEDVIGDTWRVEEAGSISELLDDPRTPDFLHDVELTLVDNRGRVEVAFDSSKEASQFRISGTNEWRATKKEDIVRFFQQHHKVPRSYLGGSTAFLLLFVLAAGVMTFLGQFFVEPLVALNVATITGALFAFVAQSHLEKVFPYIILNRKNKPYRPRIRLLVKGISVISAVLTISTFVLGI